MVHGLGGCKTRQRGKNAKRIAGEHDDVLGMSRFARARHIRNMRDGIGGAGVFSERGVVQIDVPRAHVHGDVFENRAETPGGFVNLGLAFAAKV